MSFPQWVTGQDQPEIPVNEAFGLLQFISVYAYDPDTPPGLTWNYLGGRWGGYLISAGSLSLTASSTNYLVVERATGVISASVTDTNWNDTDNYAKVYKIVTGASTVTSYEDHRLGEGGIIGASAPLTGGPALDTDQTWTGSQRGAIVTDNDLSFDLNASNNFQCTPASAGTLTFTNITAGQSGFIKFVNGSNYAISAAATTKISVSDLSNISATGTYILSYFSDGTNVYVVSSGGL